MKSAMLEKFKLLASNKEAVQEAVDSELQANDPTRVQINNLEKIDAKQVVTCSHKFKSGMLKGGELCKTCNLCGIVVKGITREEWERSL